MHALVLRPEPGLSATLERGREYGLNIEGAPLFTVEPLPWDLPRDTAFDGLLLGSANAIRSGGATLDFLKGLPVFAVGQSTADAASAQGFTLGMVGEGGLQSLLDGLVGNNLHLLRLAGEDRVPLDIPDGIRIVTRTVYRMCPQPLPGDMVSALRRGGLVLLHSVAAARQFAAQCDAHGISRGTIACAVLGPRIAAVLGSGWAAVHVAPQPNDAALLAKVDELCQERD